MSASLRVSDQPVLVGVDAGATKTVAVATTPDGERRGRAQTDGANPKRHGLDVAADRIAAVAVTAAAVMAVVDGAGDAREGGTAAPGDARQGGTAAPGDAREGGTAAPGANAGGRDGSHAARTDSGPAFVFVAGAGIDRPEHARTLEAALALRLPTTRVLVVNDTLAVLRAGTPDAVGLVVPVSTGGNVIGRAADGRVTDRGHGIFGGGYVLGALAARAARRGTGGQAAAVGRVGPELAALVEGAGLSWRGRRPAPEAALLGAAVVAAAESGDPYPARMVDRWCRRVEAAIREETARLGLGPSPVVILYGGLLEASPWLAGRLRDAVHRGVPGARIQDLACEPVDGAVLLARDVWAGIPVGWEFIPRR